ncbi:MAG: nucleotidyltransferase domain-containing protein [Fimbriimonadaceae bacterium]|nr:nucleotidyltransferase domain-containing protein [Fimbriimonadaceae bacterium]
MEHRPLLEQIVREHSYPLIFATVSGAHLYGFPSADSDIDLRGAHVLPKETMLGLEVGDETVEASFVREGVEMDIVSHDARKYFAMLLKRNGYVLEQVLSPLVIHTTKAHQELIRLVPGLLTKHHAHHYLGFARTEWGLFEKEVKPRIKPLLYIYRVLLTGIHLLRTGEVEANLATLAPLYGLDDIPELIQMKVEGTERGSVEVDVEFHRRRYGEFIERLEKERDSSTLSEFPVGREELNKILLGCRLDPETWLSSQNS